MPKWKRPRFKKRNLSDVPSTMTDKMSGLVVRSAKLFHACPEDVAQILI